MDKKVEQKLKEIYKERIENPPYNVEELLNRLIENALYGGSADPGEMDLENAAFAFVALKTLKLEIKTEEDFERILREENICGCDFLAAIGWFKINV